MRTVQIGSNIKVGAGEPLLIIAGPCQIESKAHCFKIADFLFENLKNLPINLVFKSSYDKANRTSINGTRGLGLEEGLEVLDSVKKEYGLPVTTDVHSPEQAKLAAEVVDILQIPAFLCRQTDLLVAAGETNCAVNIKKGQFLHPSDMAFAAEKVAKNGNHNIMLCERGTCFGYRDLVVDPRSFLLMKDTGYPVIYDATHSVQQMGGASGSSGGERRFVEALGTSAAALGVDGIFFECHDNPSKAPSDGACMLPLESVKNFVERLCRVKDAAK